MHWIVKDSFIVRYNWNFDSSLGDKHALFYILYCKLQDYIKICSFWTTKQYSRRRSSTSRHSNTFWAFGRISISMPLFKCLTYHPLWSTVCALCSTSRSDFDSTRGLSLISQWIVLYFIFDSKANKLILYETILYCRIYFAQTKENDIFINNIYHIR